MIRLGTGTLQLASVLMLLFHVQIWNSAAATDGILGRTLVFFCPYVFAPCYFWTTQVEQWKDHLVIAHGERLDSAAQMQPDLLFEDDAAWVDLLE